jgi:hypothetical protein
MRAIIAEPLNILHWKKFFLLATIIYTDIAGQRKQTLGRRLALLLQDNWTEFSIRLFKNPHQQKPSTPNNNNLSKKIDQLQRAGEIGSIAALLRQSSSSTRLVVDQEVINKLQDKHPRPTVPVPDALKNHQPSNISADLQINPETLRKIIFRRAKLKAPGLEKFRFDHLRPLIGSGNITAPDQNEFADCLARVVALIADTNAPADIFTILRDNVLVGLPKDNGDIRPIGMGVTLRKLVSIYFLR